VGELLSDLSSVEQNQLAGHLSRLLGSMETRSKQKQDTAVGTRAGNPGRLSNPVQG